MNLMQHKQDFDIIAKGHTYPVAHAILLQKNLKLIEPVLK